MMLNKQSQALFYINKEMKEIQDRPSINKLSEKIINEKRNSTSPFKVSEKAQKIEDRLLELHKISKREQENRIKQEEQKIKDMSRPSIGSRSKGNIQTFLDHKLAEYIKKKEYSKQALKEKYSDKDCTFTPLINKRSNSGDSES